MKRFIASLKEAEIRNVLAILVILLSFAVQVLIIVRPMPAQNHDIIITTVVLTLGLQGSIIAYFFGASKIDRKKGELDKIEN